MALSRSTYGDTTIQSSLLGALQRLDFRSLNLDEQCWQFWFINISVALHGKYPDGAASRLIRKLETTHPSTDRRINEEVVSMCAALRSKCFIAPTLDLLDQSRKLFTATSCIVCHSFEGEGGLGGPDLTSAGRRYDSRDLLDNILNPNKTINEKYGMLIYSMKDGKTQIGHTANKIASDASSIDHVDDAASVGSDQAKPPMFPMQQLRFSVDVGDRLPGFTGLESEAIGRRQTRISTAHFEESGIKRKRDKSNTLKYCCC